MEEEVKKASWSKLLADLPPGTELFDVPDFFFRKFRAAFEEYRAFVSAPVLKMWCAATACDGLRLFEGSASSEFETGRPDVSHVTLSYSCRNCGGSKKFFSVVFVRDKTQELGALASKIGEWPPFGGKLSRRMLKLIDEGPARELFMRGRSAENRGLGIGAFTYYRRVLDLQKARIFDEVLKVARASHTDASIIETLEWAKDAWQFADSIDRIKDAIPQSLLIGGQNPLLLLQSACSAGIHYQGDAECLDAAQDIRNVLVALGERISEMLSKDAELNASVGRIVARLGQLEAKKNDP